MENDNTHPEHIVNLARRHGLHIEGPAGTIVRVTHGEVWITRHHDTTDHILVAGELLRHDGRGTTVVSATKDARIEIRRPCAEPLLARVLRRLWQPGWIGA